MQWREANGLRQRQVTNTMPPLPPSTPQTSNGGWWSTGGEQSSVEADLGVRAIRQWSLVQVVCTSEGKPLRDQPPLCLSLSLCVALCGPM